MAAFKNHDLLKTHNFYGLYEKAIEAKLKPSGNFCRDKAQVEATIEEVKAVFCSFYTYLFSELSGITITTYQAYIQAVHKQQHSSQTLQQLIKNMLLNIKEVGFSSIFSPWLCLYPRYRLFLALPYFLFDWKVSTEYIVKVLGGVTDSSDQNTLFKQFYKLWQRFN